MSEKDLDQEHPYDYIPEGHLLDATSKKEDARLFVLYGDAFIDWGHTSSITHRWRFILNKLGNNGGMDSPHGGTYGGGSFLYMTREQILSMNTWKDIERYLDRLSRDQNENPVISIKKELGTIRILEGFEGYFIEEWLKN